MIKMEEIIGRMKALGLIHSCGEIERLLSIANQNELSHIECLSTILDCEIDQRNAHRIAQNRIKANIPKVKTIEEFDFRAQTSISKREINELLNFQFIDNRENLVFIGNSSLGFFSLFPGFFTVALNQHAVIR